MSGASFRIRLHQAFAALAVLIAGATFFTFFCAREIDAAAMRSRNAQAVLAAHITLSNSAFTLFKQMSDAALLNQVVESAFESRLVDRVRGDIRVLRRLIADEVRELGAREDETEELERLAAIEREIEMILADYAQIRVGWRDGEPRDRRRAIAALLDARIDVTFSNLVSAAIAEERREVADADDRLSRVSGRIRLSSILIAILAAPLFLFVLVYINRTLLRSLGALSQGADAYARGDLMHPIPPLPSREFDAIRERLVHMARELGAKRDDLRSLNERLEEDVAKRTAELADANRLLEEADEQRRNFFADVSHELRTPLTVIRGEAEIALRGVDRTPADYRESLSRIAEQSMQMSRLVEDLLFIARADAGEPRLETRSVALHGLLTDAARSFESVAVSRGVRLRVANADPGAVVVGDRGRLAQVLGVLIDNAVRYSREGGEVRLSSATEGLDALVSIEDDGIGIAPGDSDRVFERFYRGDNAREQSAGAGLGLPVAKAIIEAHKGHIRLQPSASGGVRATISLPVEAKLRAIS